MVPPVRGVVCMAAMLVFLGATSAEGSQLFELDGSGAAAVDLAGYPVGGSPIAELTPFASGLYFSGGDGADTGLWVLHGAPAPAALLTAGLSADLDPKNLTVVGSTLFLSGLDAAGHLGLYASDGTAAGTAAIAPAGAAASGLAPNWFASLDGRLYFSGRDSGGSADLWVSDGTAAGTSALAVANVDTRNLGTFGPGLDPTNLTVANGTLFFSGYDVAGTNTLWVSDGTAAGTTEILAAGAAKAGLAPVTSNIVAFGGKAYFAGTDAAGNVDLWSSDGTVAGTTALAVAGAGATGITPVSLTVFDGALYFGGTGADGTTGLWRSDGTAAGTTELAVALAGAGGLAPVAVDSSDSPDVAMTVFDGALYFAGTGADGNSDLWTSDGTAAGTVQVSVPGAAASGLLPSDFAVVDLAAAAGTVPAATGTPVSALPAGTATGVVVTTVAGGTGSLFLTSVGGQSLVGTTATGNDVVNSRGTDTINAGGGTVVVYASGAAATVNGGAGALVFVAGAGNYTAGGGAGVDILYGGAGSDVLTGGAGVNSILVAGFGNTSLVGGAGRAALMYGGVGASSFAGSAGGGDTMVGGGGGNTYFMTDGDVAFGGPSGPDVFHAGTGSALIVEGPGTTGVMLGGGAATAFAGTGADSYTVTQGVGGSAAIIGFKPGDQLVLSGYGAQEAGTALAGAQTGSFGTSLRLSDGTQVTLFGVALSAGQITTA